MPLSWGSRGKDDLHVQARDPKFSRTHAAGYGLQRSRTLMRGMEAVDFVADGPAGKAAIAATLGLTCSTVHLVRMADGQISCEKAMPSPRCSGGGRGRPPDRHRAYHRGNAGDFAAVFWPQPHSR